MLYFSPTTLGFYDSALGYPALPPDVVELTPEEHHALLQAQARGRRITADADGRPALAPEEPPPDESR